jgi:hypothetical protein
VNVGECDALADLASLAGRIPLRAAYCGGAGGEQHGAEDYRERK